MNNLFSELKRRNVFRVAGVYAVVGWLLAQIATTLEEALGLPAWFDGLIVALLLLGFPIALVFAWAFELTPEGVLRTEDVPVDESITADTGRKLDVAIVIGLFVLVTIIVWQQVREAPTTQQPAASEAAITEAPVSAASIAVLPFTDLSPEGDQGYFSDGIAEEILNVLVGVDGLDVTSRTSSFQFKNAGLGIPQIAAELNVRHVLEGSVRKSGNAIRVTAQLIDSSNDKHLWSDTYDSPLTTENIFHIQDEIANSIVVALRDALGVGGLEPIVVKATTRNLDAYDLFLQARPLFHARQDLDIADEMLARALERDAEFVAAWELRAALQVLKVDYGYSNVPRPVAEEQGRRYVTQALELEPRSATALAVLGMIDGNAVENLRSNIPVAEILARLSRAVELDPRNASALNWRGLRYLAVGYLEAALEDFEACIDHEPFYVPCVENHFSVLAAMGRDEESLAAYVRALNTSSTKVEFAHLPALARLGEELAFKTVTNTSQMLMGWRHHDDLWRAYQDPGGDHSELIASIESYLAVREGGYSDLTSFVTHPLGTGWRIPDRLIMWDPMLRRYRQSAEFKNYIREVGSYDYWLETGFPPQCRPLGDDDFECD